MRRRIILPLLVLMAGGMFGCRSLVQASEDFALSAPWQDYQRIVVRTRNGGVGVRTADVGEVKITGTKTAGGVTLAEAEENLALLTITAQADVTDATVFMVELEYPDTLANLLVGASFDILLPAACAADIRTGNGAITVHGLKDELLLHTSNGRVVTEDVVGTVDARTSNGAISIEKVVGNVTLTTSNGKIRASGIDGTCRLETSNGAVQAEGVHGSLDVHTSNGRIGVNVTPPADGSVVLRSSNGSINVQLPADFAADVDIATSNGRVNLNSGGAAVSAEEKRKHSLRAKLNGGGGTVKAVTSNGSVTIECR
ncbi:MAG: DUF4097 domain-containing protein [Planctomycetes bacterium]|nr:DUF4097 domain-containing protein [Planctomycetota bacterium]